MASTYFYDAIARYINWNIIIVWSRTGQCNKSIYRNIRLEFIYKDTSTKPKYDGHYLCTVAAGGHKEIVKPIRLGRRGKKYIVVNRQLCIANAFEQIIEEKAPRFHYVVRSFYDKYGYPVAKHINSKYAADFVYFLMKPLEQIFLIVIYLFDSKPKIVQQYSICLKK